MVLYSVARAKRTLECRKNGRRVVGRAKEGSWTSEESCGVDDGTWDWRFYTTEVYYLRWTRSGFEEDGLLRSRDLLSTMVHIQVQNAPSIETRQAQHLIIHQMAKHPKLAGAMISFQSKYIPDMSKIQVAVVARRVV